MNVSIIRHTRLLDKPIKKVAVLGGSGSFAINAAKAMGLNLCGVDILQSKNGPVVMEVNSSPGLEGVEKATGLDIAGKVIAYMEKHAKPGATKTKGKG